MTDRVVCPNCGYANSTYRTTCKQCHEKLPQIIESSLDVPQSQAVPPQSQVVPPEETRVAEVELYTEDLEKYIAVNAEDDQSQAYLAYFELIRSFNSANAEYLKIADEIAVQRQKAIQRAVEIHIRPAISTYRGLQNASLIGAILAILFVCGGFSLLGNSSSASDAVSSAAQSGFGGIVILASLALGVLALIVLRWVSSKISELVSKERNAKSSPPPSLPN